MKKIATILFASMLALGALSVVPSSVYAKDKAKVQKCDKEGKVCTTGAYCKPANCKNKKEKVN